MRIDIEDFKTGWFGLGIGLRPNEIANLIEALARLRDSTAEHPHFHMVSKCDGPTPAVADIEFYMLPDDQADNAQL